MTEIISFNTIDPVQSNQMDMLVSRDAKMKSGKNVNLDETKLKKILIDQGKVNVIQAKDTKKLQKDVTKADIKSTEVNGGETYSNTRYMTKMTQYHWDLYTDDQQLKLYRDAVYKKNKFNYQIMRQQVIKKLVEDLTQKKQ